jgi:CubicO group peptidase (beta-lactamase class C family)
VAKNGAIVSLESMGKADLDTGRDIDNDDLFWIASMTKPMTGVAVLMLQDQGKLSIHDTVETHLPEFGEMWMIEDRSKEQLILKRPARKITILDLLTHTAGVPNVDEPRAHSTLAELVSQISQRPLEFEPGSRWQYSNSGINTLGRIVEVVSGQLFQAFLDMRLFGPLGMQNTTFFPSRSQVQRLAKPYSKNKDTGKLEETSVYFVKGDLWDTERTVKPAGGLYSTAEDLRRFYQMMLDDGVWNTKRLLSSEVVHALTHTQTGEIKTGFTEGMSWGLGFQVVKEPQGVTSMLSPGTFGHGGAYATQSWADPNHQAIYMLMIQRRGFRNGNNSPVRDAFQTAAAAALEGN